MNNYTSAMLPGQFGSNARSPGDQGQKFILNMFCILGLDQPFFPADASWGGLGHAG